MMLVERTKADNDKSVEWRKRIRVGEQMTRFTGRLFEKVTETAVEKKRIYLVRYVSVT